MIQERIKKNLAKRVKGRLPPVRIVSAVNRVRNRVTQLGQRLMPPQMAMIELLTASWLTQALHVAAKLEIADRLYEGPKSTTELAMATNTHAGALGRLLRMLESFGIFRMNDSSKYELTPMGECLRRDSENSVRDMALFQGGVHWRHWGQLEHAIKTGEPSLDHVEGRSLFEFLAKNSEAAAQFDGAMINATEGVAQAVLSAYDFSEFSQICDVGGGRGAFLSRILQAHPRARGTLVDRDFVVQHAKPLLDSRGVLDRCEVVAGDFFRELPEGCDLYVLKHIVHDWNDAKAGEILKRVRKAMHKKGKVLLIEALIDDEAGTSIGKLLDLEMLVTTGGRERTEGEYRVLLADQHLKLTRVISTASPVSLIEAERA